LQRRASFAYKGVAERTPPRATGGRQTAASGRKGDFAEMSDPVGLLFGILLLVIAGSFVWRYLRSGSLTGALLGGKIESTIGEITLSRAGLSSSVLRIHVMRETGQSDPFLGLSVVSKAPLGASMVPVRLTRAQVQELQTMLQQALPQLAA
jgi:hypothetical protein